MIRTARSVCILLTLASITVPVLAGPPDAPRTVVTDNYHGTKISDPYRWLEGSDGAAGLSDEDAAKLDERVGVWTDAENAYTREYLENLPGRAAIEERIAELLNVDSVGSPTMCGNSYFYRERQAGWNQSALFVREGLDGEPRLLLDANTIDDTGRTSLSWTEPSPDGSLVAFGLDISGAENQTLYLLDTQSGDWLADEISDKVGGVSWLPDASGFVYRNLSENGNPYSGQVKFHKVGTHPRQDPVLFAQYEGSTTWGPWGGLSRDGRWLILGYSTGGRANDLWVVDFDRWQRTGELEKVTIAEGIEDAGFWGDVVGDTMYLQTSLDAPNGCIYRVDLNQPDRANWQICVPERSDAVIDGVNMARGMMVITYGYKAHTIMEKFDLTGQSLGAVNLPGIGSASIKTNDDRTEAFLGYASFNEPRSIYRVDLTTNERSLWARPEVAVDPSIVEVKQVTYTSKDGTPVTMFVVHKKGLKLDGTNPTLLSGYGGFNISQKPYFSSTRFPWYEEGGVYAVANLRGGGEYGEAWHRAGMLENKQNVYDDFIAAGEWLIDQGYTNPEKLAISGGSNGGLLVGAMAVQRPDLFRAVLCSVPLLDMLRYHQFLMGQYWVPEYGSSADAKQFKFLNAYSPYHNIEDGVRYPAMFLTAGENDARVHPLHARKMAAALRAATSADQTDRPILLWVERESGHGSGKPVSMWVRDIADREMFLRSQLGMLN